MEVDGTCTPRAGTGCCCFLRQDTAQGTRESEELGWPCSADTAGPSSHHHSALLRAQSALAVPGDTPEHKGPEHRDLPNLCRQGTQGLTQQLKLINQNK